MNSRERIMASIHHKEPDRVPLDLGATPSSGISAIAYANLKKHMGITQGHIKVYDVVQQLAEPEDNILDMFGVDVVDIGRLFNTEASDWYDISLQNGEKAQYPIWFRPEKDTNGDYITKDKDNDIIARMPKNGVFYDQECFPYIDAYPDNFDDLDRQMGKAIWQAYASSPWDKASEKDFYKTLREKAIAYKASSDKALVLGIGCNLFEWGTFLRRIDNFLMDLILQPEKVEALLDALMQRHLASLEKACEYVGDIVDIIKFGDDLGTNDNTFMSPQTYRQLFKPRHKELCNYVHKHSSMAVMLHSCGSIRALIPDMIEAGFQIINPVQTTARGMDPKELKREYGKDITFWGGGCNTRWVLNYGSEQEVSDYVKRMLDIFMPGGGYVFNTEHNIMPEVPPENILAMYKAVKEY